VAGGGTGGHLMPALSLADALRAVDSDVEPVLVGARRGVEADLLPTREPRYPYFLLPVEPLYRRTWWKNVRWLRVLPALVSSCRRILREIQPALVVGTGGYAAGPIVFFARRRRIPTALQEQNAYPGLTTRLLARRVDRIYLGFDEARRYLRAPASKIVTMGNPIAPPPGGFPDRLVPADEVGVPKGMPVCFVMGGSQGARAINVAVATAIDAGVLDDVALLWSTGRGMWSEYSRYHRPPQRHVVPFWSPVTTAYAVADLVVARAGAMTTAELRAWGLPSILIPLPTAAAGHQTTNAEALARDGAAVHLPESELTAERLAATIHGLVGSDQLDRMAASARRGGRPDAARRIAEDLLTLIR
jgi:UDP-N-acetylglucosamine--N-acetylmuramyl-(pentapeptide) pyrophosphoryl-undecaprenol N-acetylglucosamine transferase